VLKSALLEIFLSGCAVSSLAETGPLDLCELEGMGAISSIRVKAIVETDTQHGMFLVSSDCKFSIQAGKITDTPDPSVVDFLRYVGTPMDLSWRRYEVDVTGAIVIDDSSNSKFEFSRFHSFRKI